MLNPYKTKKITFCPPMAQLTFRDMDLNLIVETERTSVVIDSLSGDVRLYGEFERRARRR